MTSKSDFKEAAEKYVETWAHGNSTVTQDWMESAFLAGAEHGRLEFANKLYKACETIEQLQQQLAEIMHGNDDVVTVQNSKLKQELAVARERLGPAGYKIVQEVAELRKQLAERNAEIERWKRQHESKDNLWRKAVVERADYMNQVEKLEERQMHEGKHVCNGVNIIDGLRTRLQDAEEIMRKYSKYCDREEAESGCQIYGCAESRAYFAKYKAKE